MDTGFQISIVKDQVGRFTAQLQGDPRHISRGLRHDLRAGGRGAGERDLANEQEERSSFIQGTGFIELSIKVRSGPGPSAVTIQ